MVSICMEGVSTLRRRAGLEQVYSDDSGCIFIYYSTSIIPNSNISRCLRFISSKAEVPAAAISRPLPHYKLGDLGIVPRSKPKLGERFGATSPALRPVHSRRTRSIGVQTVSAQKVRTDSTQ